MHYKQPIIGQTGREREKDREKERETLRGTEREREDEEQSGIQLIKVEDSGISLRWRFLSSTPLPVRPPHPLTPYFAGKMAWEGALKACFNGC